jgi:hypothetical protein
MKVLCFLLLAACAPAAIGAQFAKFGDTEVHYVVVSSMFVTEEIASQYGIERAPDRAFVNLSVLKKNVPARARVAGTVTTLLGRTRPLEFREVTEGPSIYYLAPLEHDDEDTLRFALDVTVGTEPTHRIEFQQTLYREASADEP